MSVVYRKVARDLLRNKMRTVLVVLSTAVGILALGMVISLSDLMADGLTTAWQAAQPNHVVLYVGGTVDDDTVAALARTPGVCEIEPRIETNVRWKRPGETEWRNANLIARRDYKDQRQSIVSLIGGTWPRAERDTLAVENLSATAFNLPVGSEIILQAGETERAMRITGVVRDILADPPAFGADATFFTAPKTVQDLMGFDGYTTLLIRLPQYDKEEARAVGERVKQRLEKLGLSPGTPYVFDPKRHFAQEQVDGVLLIMGVLGALSLGLSAFLVVNTVNAVLAQQLSQIGVMKAVGATVWSVMRVYLVMVLVYGLLAVALAVPLAALAACALANTLLPMFNIDVVPMQIVPRAAWVQLIVGLLTPVLAAAWPVLLGARITVRQAIASYGLGADFGRGLLDKLIANIRGLSRPLALSLRNTFRRKGRVALTLITLALAGAMFIVVMSVSSTLNYTLERLFASYGFDVFVVFDNLQRFDRAEAIARTVPGVAGGEVWMVQRGRLDMGGSHKRDVTFWALPADSTIFQAEMKAGRWLRPDDENVMVVNQKIAQDEGLKVGDQVNVNLGPAGDSTWQVVGLLVDINNDGQTVFVPRAAFARALRQPGRGGLFWIKTDQHDGAAQAAAEKQLRAAFEANSMKINYSLTASKNKEQNFASFNIITLLLLAMSVLAGVVGSFGLMGAMSINVLERSKEIGVMRAIGASSPTIVAIFIVEGVIVGLLSLIFAVPLSYPGARLLADALGTLFFQAALNFQYSTVGLLLWLMIVVVLAVLASLWPALRAARVSVRETLAYE